MLGQVTGVDTSATVRSANSLDPERNYNVNRHRCTNRTLTVMVVIDKDGYTFNMKGKRLGAGQPNKKYMGRFPVSLA